MNQTNHFFNPGYGWLCKHCSAATTSRQQQASGNEPKRHEPPAFELALACWTNAKREALVCPRCRIEEQIKSC